MCVNFNIISLCPDFIRQESQNQVINKLATQSVITVQLYSSARSNIIVSTSLSNHFNLFILIIFFFFFFVRQIVRLNKFQLKTINRIKKSEFSAFQNLNPIYLRNENIFAFFSVFLFS